MHYGDLTDATNLIRLIQEHQPDEIYNLAAQSHVQVSFETPEYTANADALGTLRLLEAIRILGLDEEDTLLSGLDIRALRQGAGGAADARRRRSIRARPMPRPSSMPTGSRSITARPTACMPRTASSSTTKARLRGETFVTRKITRAVAAIERGLQERLYLGNLDAKRDWGHARDFVEGMWLMLQQPQPTTTCWRPARCTRCASSSSGRSPASGVSIAWQGKRRRGSGLRRQDRQRCSCAVDPRYFRPTEVDSCWATPARRNASSAGSTRPRLPSWSPRWCESDLAAVAGAARNDRSAGEPRRRRCSSDGGSRSRLERPRWASGSGSLGIAAWWARRWCAGWRARAARSSPSSARRGRSHAPGRRWSAGSARPGRDAIFVAAAKVGGILANDTFPADFLYDNLMIEANIIQAAHEAGVEKLLFLGSSCIYPKLAPQPITRGCAADRPARADQRVVCDRQDRRHQARARPIGANTAATSSPPCRPTSTVPATTTILETATSCRR